MKKCLKCGTMLQEGCSFCPKCGQKYFDIPEVNRVLNNKKESDFIHNETRNRTVPIIITAILAFLGIIIAGIFMLVTLTPQNDLHENDTNTDEIMYSNQVEDIDDTTNATVSNQTLKGEGFLNINGTSHFVIQPNISGGGIRLGIRQVTLYSDGSCSTYFQFDQGDVYTSESELAKPKDTGNVTSYSGTWEYVTYDYQGTEYMAIFFTAPIAYFLMLSNGDVYLAGTPDMTLSAIDILSTLTTECYIGRAVKQNN